MSGVRVFALVGNASGFWFTSWPPLGAGVGSLVGLSEAVEAAAGPGWEVVEGDGCWVVEVVEEGL